MKPGRFWQFKSQKSQISKRGRVQKKENVWSPCITTCILYKHFKFQILNHVICVIKVNTFVFAFNIYVNEL